MNTMLEKRKQAVLVTKRCYFEKKTTATKIGWLINQIYFSQW